MKKRTLSFLLILVMVVCFGIAVSYPVQYFMQKESNETDMAALRAMRMSALDNSADMEQTASADDNAGQETPPTGGSVLTDAALGGSADNSEIAVPETPAANAQQAGEKSEPSAASEDKPSEAKPETISDETPAVNAQQAGEKSEPSAASEDKPSEAKPETISDETPAVNAQQAGEKSEPSAVSEGDDAGVNLPEAKPESESPADPDPTLAVEDLKEVKMEPDPTKTPEPTEEPIDRHDDEGYVLAYPNKEHVQFDESKILSQYQDIYQLNNDLVGWLTIPGTVIDYPVVRSDDPEYYLDRDFFGETNKNGQLILDSACDPWTPSYNLVISGHNMKTGAMFAQLINYASESFWSKHKTFTFDSVMREGTYVVFAAFYSADYDEDEAGFRYNADIQYRLDAKLWLEDIMENCEYDTGIDVEFGDEFLTLTTCQYHRENGRFVVVARRVREGEVIE